mgnify:CR=1 FL=1|jgi:Ras-related protein Rab-5C
MINQRSFKVVLLGDAGTGKSSIMRRLVEDYFNPTEESTIGAAFFTKRFNLPSGDHVTLQLWDTAGQERYANLAPMYWRNSDAIVSIYDVMDKKSYFNALDWLKKTCGPIDLNGNSKPLLALVGNKIDCLSSEREVSRELGEKGTKENMGLANIFFETSAKDGDNVQLLFKTIAATLSDTVENDLNLNRFLLDDDANNANDAKKCPACQM